MALRAGFRTGKRKVSLGRDSISPVARSMAWPMLLIAALGSVGADEQPPARFRDALDRGTDWDIAVPELETPRGFDAAIRAGTALDSAAYLSLDRELRGVKRRLDLDPADPDSLAELEALRERLRRRVEVNFEAGFLYAAGVYIELLRIAGASAPEIRRLSATLRARRE